MITQTLPKKVLGSLGIWWWNTFHGDITILRDFPAKLPSTPISISTPHLPFSDFTRSKRKTYGGSRYSTQENCVCAEATICIQVYNILVNWDDYSQYIRKTSQVLQTTNQFFICIECIIYIYTYIYIYVYWICYMCRLRASLVSWLTGSPKLCLCIRHIAGLEARHGFTMFRLR